MSNTNTSKPRLGDPLSIDEIDFRVQSIMPNGESAIVLPYKNARVDMQRLDDAFTPLGWQREHFEIDGRLYCRIGVWNSEISQWVWKSDVGVESNTEAEKGQASDAFKRAGFNWNIGRELYDWPVLFAKLYDGDTYTRNEGGKTKFYATSKLRPSEWRWVLQYNEGARVPSFIGAKDKQERMRIKVGNYINQ